MTDNRKAVLKGLRAIVIGQVNKKYLGRPYNDKKRIGTDLPNKTYDIPIENFFTNYDTKELK